MKDTKFYIEFSTILSLIVIALYILNFVSLKDKDKAVVNSDLLAKLSNIECDVNSFNFRKKIIKTDVVVIKKEIKIPKIVQKEVLITSTKVKKPVKQIEKNLFVFEKLKKDFSKTNDYKIALKLSRLFYVSKKYKKAIKWSMIANELNKKDDSSWILFAKAKLKLGDKKVANMALKSYQRVYNSIKIKKLLSRISS